MNMTKKLAKERFDGDQIRAIHYIIENYAGEQLEEYMYDFNWRQASLFLRIANCMAEYQEFCEKDHNESTTDEENEPAKDEENEPVKDEENEPAQDEENEYGLSFFMNNPNAKNPYSAKIIKNTLIVLGIVPAIVAVVNLPATYIDNSTTTYIFCLLEVLSTTFSLKLAVDILEYFRFRQKKKIWGLVLSSHKAKEE